MGYLLGRCFGWFGSFLFGADYGGLVYILNYLDRLGGFGLISAFVAVANLFGVADSVGLFGLFGRRRGFLATRQTWSVAFLWPRWASWLNWAV